MPSYEHEGLIRLFRNRPELAPELLRDALRVELPAYSEARIESADLTDLEPAERHADLVVLLVDDKPVLGIVVEVQLSTKAEKRMAWPVYVVGLRARLKCPACVLVVSPSEAVAQWCREPISIGPGNVFTPLVLGPASVPRVEDRATAERDPELAVLSVMAHGDEAESDMFVRTVLEAVRSLPDERRVLYYDLLAALSDAARTALERLMASGDYEFHSDFAKKFIAQGRIEGQAQGRVEGEAQGRIEGQAQGRVEGEAKALVVLLEARAVRITDEARARILACSDPLQLDVWIRKALSIQSIDELF
jgi:hypothetical protein